MRPVTGSRALPPSVVRPLARRALQGKWASDALTEGWAPALGILQAAALAHRVLDLLPGGPHDAADPLDTLDRLLRDLPAVPVADAHGTSPPARSGGHDTRLPRPWRFGVRELPTTAELARLLDLTPDELAWFADTGHWLRHSTPPLRHYAAHLQPTAHGGARLIEAPKPRLREIQRRLLRHVLAPVPTHDVAHGFVRGRSALTAATVHAGHPVLVRADLRQFFASVTAPRVRAVFRAAGYPPEVAAALTGLCTTRTPVDVLRSVPAGGRERLRRDHLPQGAPTSPALANLVARRLDVRLAGLARAHGCVVTRYADDLAFSGPAGLDAGTLLFALGRLVSDEGFALHPAKTTVAPGHTQQRLLGLVVNHTAGVARHERDALRALLHNCVVTGPARQNHEGHPDFRAHLQGRISWAAAGHPVRLARLTTMLEAISW